MTIATKFTTKGKIILSLAVFVWGLIATSKDMNFSSFAIMTSTYALIAYILINYVYQFKKWDVMYSVKGDSTKVVTGRKLHALQKELEITLNSKALQDNHYQYVQVSFLGGFRKGLAYVVSVKTLKENTLTDKELSDYVYQSVQSLLSSEIGLPTKVIVTIGDKNTLYGE